MKTTKERKINRVRSKISGTEVRPRLAVNRTNTQISAQLINDEKGITIASARGVKADEVGKQIAKKALEKKITSAVFDRRYYKYHGKIKLLADSARKEGLKI